MKFFAIFALQLSMVLPATAQLKEFKSQDALSLVLNSPKLLGAISPAQTKFSELGLAVSTQGKSFHRQFIVRVSQTAETLSGLKTCHRNIYVSPLFEKTSTLKFKLQNRLVISQIGPAECQLPTSLAAAQ